MLFRSAALLLPAAFLISLEALWSLASRTLDVSHLFLLIAIQWLLVWSSANLIITCRFHTLPDPPGIPLTSRTLLLHLALLGFLTNLIFALALRLLPNLLHLTRLRHRALVLALILYNLGFIALLPTNLPSLNLPGALLMFIATVLYLAGLNFLRPTAQLPVANCQSPMTHYPITIAFLWLAASLLMLAGEFLYRLLDPSTPIPPAYLSATRHAFTLGFLTTLLLGTAFRLLPYFHRPHLAMPRLVFVSGGLLLLVTPWRIVTELLSIKDSSYSYLAMGPTGLLELAAVLLFTLALLRTLLANRRPHQSNTLFTAATRLTEALTANPALAKTLRQLQIPIPSPVPPTLTLGSLALAHNLPLATFLTTDAAKEGPPR